MLPFDNKSEFQVIVDMPDGTTLEQTTRVAQALGGYLRKQPEIATIRSTRDLGSLQLQRPRAPLLPAPRPNQADIQVNLLRRTNAPRRATTSPSALRPELVKIGEPFWRAYEGERSSARAACSANAGCGSLRPGSTSGQIEVAEQIKQIFQQTPGVVDVDWYVEDPQTEVST